MPEETTVPEETVKPPEASKAKKPTNIKKIIMIALGVVVVLIILLLVIINMVTSGSVKVSNQFMNAVQARQGAVAYGLFSSEAQKAVTQEQLSTAIDRVGPILNTKEKMVSKEVSAETGTQSKAKVVYEVKGTDGNTYTITIDLIKEGDAWKVLNFDSKK